MAPELKKYITYFSFSIYLLTIFQVLYYKHPFSYEIFQVAWVVCMVLLIFSTYNLLNDFEFESSYFRLMFNIFLLYEGVIIFRGLLHNVTYSFDEFWLFITKTHILWPFLIPFFIYFTKEISAYSFLFKWIFRFGIVFLFLCVLVPEIILNRVPAEMAVIPMTAGLGYILIFSSYLSNRQVNLAFIIMLVGILIFIFLARRSGAFTLLGLLVAAYLLNLKNETKPKLFRYFPIIIGICAIFLVSNSSFYSSLTSRMEQRLTENSRSYVFQLFSLGMQDDLYFGKGMQGTYFCPVGGELEDEGVVFADVENRDVIENGYLQLILSGGIVHLVLFVLVLLPAAILGIFKSSNLFARGSGAIVLLWLIDMFLFGLPLLRINYIFVWICVGICYKKSLRDKTDDEIRAEFQNSESI